MKLTSLSFLISLGTPHDRIVPWVGVVDAKVDVEMTRSPSPEDMAGGLSRPLTPDEAGWLACVARMAGEGKKAVRPLYGRAAGRVALGRGAGGDWTLEIDRACEAAIRGVLEHEAPGPYLLVSEEAGMIGAADAPWRVIVDPLDGSLNAKRGLGSSCASIAVADGETLDAVTVGYVEDYTRPRRYAAVKGAGVVCTGTARAEPDRFESRLVEMVLLEAGRPDRYHFNYRELSAMGGPGGSRDLRIRQLGSLALSLCYVATGVADVLVAAVQARSVDLAAGLLILAESGGGAAVLEGPDIWGQRLDLEKRSAFVAWRAGLDSAEIISRAAGLSRSLLVDPQ